MKPHRDANALAARLADAAKKPVPLPEAPVLKVVETMPPAPAPEAAPQPSAKKSKAAKAAAETVAITLRPTRAMLKRYTMAAADRTRETGRVISAQEMMLEQLERAS